MWSSAYTGTPAARPTSACVGPTWWFAKRCGAVPSQQPSPKTNTRGMSPRATRTRSSTSSAARVKTTVIGSGAEERSVPELRGAVPDLIDVDVLHLHVLEHAFHAELAADAALLV